MAKKQKAPKAPKTPKPVTPFNEELKKGIIIALVIILLFTSGNLLGAVSSKATANSEEETTDATEAATTAATTEATTAAPVTEATTVAPATTAAAADTTAAAADTTAAAADTTAASGDTSAAPQTTAEIVEYFNTAANKIKTEATTVTRNYEDLQHNEDKLVLPSALQSIGSSLISQFLKKDETPVDYTGDDITAKFPVQGESYVSNTTEADIKEATCTDNGDSYKIVLKYVDAVDPTDTSVANAFNIIRADDVYEAASVVKNFSANYYDATIECTIDKASGHVTAITYTLPIVLSVTAQVVVSLDAQVGMTFIDDYSIAY